MSPLPTCIVPGCQGAGEYRVEGGWKCYEHLYNSEGSHETEKS